MISAAGNYIKRIPQYTRNARHLRSVVQHGTPRKWANLARVELERKLGRIDVTGHPYLLIIDPCNYCNLRCPLCPTGLNDPGRPQSMMPFDKFVEYFDPHIPYLFEAYLHSWGESLLNKDIFRMIDYAQSNNVGTNLSSNLVTTSSDDIDNLLDAGLEYLVVSLDGTDQETYSKYRVRGDYERVISNMTELIRRRNARGMKTPVIEWQYIVMKTNEHQIPEAQELAKKFGVDLLRFIPVGMPYYFENRKEVADKWFPVTVEGRKASDHDEQQYGLKEKPGPCFYLYRSMVVNPGGGVSPCCVVNKQKEDFADLERDGADPAGIWNNSKFRSARALFSRKSVDKHAPTVCDGCDIFAKHPSKRLPMSAPGDVIISTAGAGTGVASDLAHEVTLKPKEAAVQREEPTLERELEQE